MVRLCGDELVSIKTERPDTSPHTVNKKHILIRRREHGKEPYNRKRI